jgi:SAM-dependent methyltransferase
VTAGGGSPDNFSAVAAPYADFRPGYPPELFEVVLTLPARRHRAWDCGAGNGQATIDLTAGFDEVLASDASAKQVARAARHPSVSWIVARAEAAPIAAASVDLVVAAQALHWFQHDRFYAEVQRVAAPGAAIAAWSYGAPEMHGEVGTLLASLMFDTLGAYWPPGREHVERGYRTIPFPFERISPPSLRLEYSWPLAQLIGYMRSWSATARYLEATGVDPVTEVEHALRGSWGDSQQARPIAWPLAMLAGRVTV